MKVSPKPITTASVVTRELFEAVNASGMSDVAVSKVTKTNRRTVIRWRRGETSPAVFHLEAVAQSLGYRLKLVPVEENE